MAAEDYGPKVGQAWEEVSPLVRRRVTQGTNMTVSRYEFGPGGEFPLHKHTQEQITLVIRGDVTMTMEGESRRLSAGDLIVIPPDVPHHGSVGSHGAEVVGIVAPRRSDATEIQFLEENH